MLFIATTNHIDVLDDTLIREGRFDLKLHLEKFDEDTAKEYCNRLGVSYSLLDGVSYPLSPAYLQQKVIKYKIKGE